MKKYYQLCGEWNDLWNQNPTVCISTSIEKSPRYCYIWNAHLEAPTCSRRDALYTFLSLAVLGLHLMRGVIRGHQGHPRSSEVIRGHHLLQIRLE